MKFFKLWWQNHDVSNNFLSGIHYLIISLAIIIGGVWSIYTFNVLEMASNAKLQAQNAEIQLTKAQEELKQIKEQIKGTDSSSITISAVPLRTQLGMIISITIKNNGKRPLSFDTSEGTVSIYKVNATDDKIEQTQKLSPSLYSSIRNPNDQNSSKNRTLARMHVLIGAEKTLSYIVGLKKPGLYYITFKSSPDSNFDGEDLKNGKPVEWFASSYFEISPKQYSTTNND